VIDDRVGPVSDDEVGDVADDVIYLQDGEAGAEVDDLGGATETVWASVVAGAHYAFRRAFARSGGPRVGEPGGGQDGTGAG
jgi:hypothetical protein